jgi:hypothetical protein
MTFEYHEVMPGAEELEAGNMFTAAQVFLQAAQAGNLMTRELGSGVHDLTPPDPSHYFSLQVHSGDRAVMQVIRPDVDEPEIYPMPQPCFMCPVYRLNRVGWGALIGVVAHRESMAGILAQLVPTGYRLSR